jgi:hypothetical protein
MYNKYNESGRAEIICPFFIRGEATMKVLFCPLCNKYLGKIDDRTTIDKVFVCHNCTKKIVYRIENDSYEVHKIEKNITSSGKKFF